LEKTLNALEHAKPQHRSAQARERAQKRQRGQQQMGALQDMVQREGKLLDHAQARGGEAKPDEQQGDGRVQLALRRALGELMQQYGDLMGEIPPNLGEADGAMRDAARALGQGQDKVAAMAVQKAIEALQKGGQAMGEQMAQAFGAPDQQGGDDQDDEAGDEQGGAGLTFGNPQDGDPNRPGRGNRPWRGTPGLGRRGDQRTDPLGRHTKEGSAGSDESADVTVPEEMEQARTRAIQDELRRRGAERTRPQQELDYIGRLLKEF